MWIHQFPRQFVQFVGQTQTDTDFMLCQQISPRDYACRPRSGGYIHMQTLKKGIAQLQLRETTVDGVGTNSPSLVVARLCYLHVSGCHRKNLES